MFYFEILSHQYHTPSSYFFPYKPASESLLNDKYYYFSSGFTEVSICIELYETNPNRIEYF